MDRGRDRRYDDERLLGGETYRPSARQDQARPSYRPYRSPPRRGRTPPPYVDTYAPGPDRRRSRSPQYASRGGASYRERPRSPPPRQYSPRREGRPRSPPPRARKFSRSPVRPRSPILAKRDPSPYNDRRARSPVPLKRERPASPPRGRYERREYSPPRSARPRFPNENNYRPRELSRSPPPRRSEHVSRVPSPISSRRSSPPIHPDRLANAGSRPHSPAHRNPRATYRDRSPPPRRGPSPVMVSPPPEAYRQPSPPPRERNEYLPAATRPSYTEARAQPPQTSSYRNGDPRPSPTGPPTGPAAGFSNSYTRESPTAPRSSAPVSISAHNRPGSSSMISAPSRPRGGAPFARGEPRDHSYGGPLSHRGGRPHPSSPYHGPPRPPYEPRHSPSDGVPHGPRSSYNNPATSYDGPRHHAPPPFRPNNSSSTTYPRTQRFAPTTSTTSTTNHLASLPSILPGGKNLPSADPAAEKKIGQLEEDARKLKELIEAKQREKRKGLREWGSLERESRNAGLKSEFAEQQLEKFSGEVGGGGAF